MAYTTNNLFGNLLGGGFIDSGLTDFRETQQQTIQYIQDICGIPVYRGVAPDISVREELDDDFIELKQQEEVKLADSLFQE